MPYESSDGPVVLRQRMYDQRRASDILGRLPIANPRSREDPDPGLGTHRNIETNRALDRAIGTTPDQRREWLHEQMRKHGRYCSL